MLLENPSGAVGAKVRLSPPPPALMRKINPLVRRVMRSRRLSRGMSTKMLLEFQGRRTGRTIVVPVALHMIDGSPTAFTGRPWRLNFTGGIAVTVTHRGHVRHGRGLLVNATPEEVGRAIRTALDNGVTPFGLKVARSFDPTPADLTHTGLSLIRFDFAPVTDAEIASGHSRLGSQR